MTSRMKPCGGCVARNVKCDGHIPCEACIYNNQQDSCVPWVPEPLQTEDLAEGDVPEAPEASTATPSHSRSFLRCLTSVTGYPHLSGYLRTILSFFASIPDTVYLFLVSKQQAALRRCLRDDAAKHKRHPQEHLHPAYRLRDIARGFSVTTLGLCGSSVTGFASIEERIVGYRHRTIVGDGWRTTVAAIRPKDVGLTNRRRQVANAGLGCCPPSHKSKWTS